MTNVQKDPKKMIQHSTWHNLEMNKNDYNQKITRVTFAMLYLVDKPSQ